MEWDLGIGGLALLAVLSAVFGALVQVVGGRGSPHRMWLIGATTYFAVSILWGEAWFRWVADNDLEENFDGLSLDEAILAIVPSVVVVAVARRIIELRRQADVKLPIPAGRP